MRFPSGSHCKFDLGSPSLVTGEIPLPSGFMIQISSPVTNAILSVPPGMGIGVAVAVSVGNSCVAVGAGMVDVGGDCVEVISTMTGVGVAVSGLNN